MQNILIYVYVNSSDNHVTCKCIVILVGNEVEKKIIETKIFYSRYKV